MVGENLLIFSADGKELEAREVKIQEERSLREGIKHV